MSKGLTSLRRWQKCQRKVANAVLRAMPKDKRSQLKSAANALARDACSKGQRSTTKAKRSTRRRASRREQYVSPRSMPDFASHLTRREPVYEPPFNPETF